MLDNFVYEVHQLQSGTLYWQAIAITCENEGSDYSFMLTQEGVGHLPDMTDNFRNVGKITLESGSFSDFQRLADKGEELCRQVQASNLAFMRYDRFGSVALDVLLHNIARDGGDKFPLKLVLNVRKSLGFDTEETDASTETEPDAQLQALSNELSWLSQYWGATA